MPVVREEVVNVAWDLLALMLVRVPVPRMAVRSRKVTEPRGGLSGEPTLELAVTVAVRVTFWPGLAVVGETVSVVLVLNCATSNHLLPK